jgi:hypothetical protein
LKATIADIEKTRSKINSDAQKSKKATAPTPKESTTSLVHTKPIIKYERKGDNAAMVSMKLVKQKAGNILEISLNRDHPFLEQRESFELSAIGEFLAVDYFATYVLRNKEELNHDDFLKIRDDLLREYYLKK